MKADIRAVVVDRTGIDTMIRPALFAWQTDTGIAWVEPSYLDELNSMPAYHERVGDVIVTDDNYWCATTDGIVQICAIDHVEDPSVTDERITQIRENLDSAIAELKARGTTVADERARMHAMLTGPLVEPK